MCGGGGVTQYFPVKHITHIAIAKTYTLMKVRDIKNENQIKYLQEKEVIMKLQLNKKVFLLLTESVSLHYRRA